MPDAVTFAEATGIDLQPIGTDVPKPGTFRFQLFPRFDDSHRLFSQATPPHHLPLWLSNSTLGSYLSP